MAASEDAPAATYTHLYIRRPDPYRHHVGDVDFLMPAGRYAEVRASLLGGAAIRGLRVYEPQTTNMLELHDPDSDALGYIVDTPLSASIPN